MSDFSSTLEQAIYGSIETLQSLKKIESEIARAAEMIEQCLRAGNKLRICGNGGSASEAAHFASELVGRFAKYRRCCSVTCLSGDGGGFSCCAHGYGGGGRFGGQAGAFGVE